MKKNMKHPQHSVCFQERPLVIAVRHALPYLVGLSLALAMAQNASSRSSDSAAAFTATQLVRQFTLKNTVSQVSMGMQGYISEINGEQRGPAMGARPAGFPSDMGSVPATVNLPRRDGAGRPLGYCAWDNAAAVTSADYNAGQGVSNPLVYAIVSPGLNGNMQTTCANVLAAGVGVGDDHVQVVAPMQVSSVQYKSSVATFSDLPPGAEGDIRLVRDTNKLYSYVGGAWAPVQAGPFEADAAGGVGAIAYTTGKVTVADFQAATATITGATTIAGALSGSSATFTGAVTANTFTGNGAGLVDLNADNFSTGVVSPQFGGTGVNGAAAANGTLLIGNGTGYTLGTLTAGTGVGIVNGAGTITISNTGVTSLAGTANQVNVSAATGAVTLSLPQNIATTSTPTFAGAFFGGNIDVASISQAGVPATLAFQYASDTGSTVFAEPNLGLGTGALAGRKSAGNVAIGMDVLGRMATLGYYDESGTWNTGVGYQALYSNDYGDENTAVGYKSLYANTEGYYNTAIGSQALLSNTTGTSNTANGAYALSANTTGSYNSASGAYALSSNTTGGSNTASGYYSLYYNTTGVNNTASGYYSLFYTRGSRNTGFGYLAGINNSNGSNNTFLGNNADANTGSLSFATAIGSNSNVATSNTLALGRNSMVDQVVIGTNTRNNTFANTKLYVNGVTNLNGDLRGTTATFSGAVTANSFSGNGSGLTNLNASNFTTGTVPVARGGTGLDGSAAANGSLLIGNGTGYTLGTLTAGTGVGIVNGAGTITISNTGVTSLAGTANQVNVSAATGAITLSLPQDIATTSTPTFGGMTLNGGLTGTTATFSGAVTVGSLGAQRLDVGTSAGGVTYPNVIVGTGAMPGAQSGFGANTALGIDALKFNTTGHSNTSIGDVSLHSNTTGFRNVALGRGAMYYNTTGYRNAGVGQASIYYNTTGYYNASVGASSLYYNTTGNENSSVGGNSLANNLTGNRNSALGYYADVLSGALNYGTAIGADSRVGTSNTIVLGALGSNKKASLSTVDDQVVIGATSRSDTFANTKLYVSGVTNLNGDLRGTTGNFSGNVALNTSGFAGNTSMRDLRLYSSTSVSPWDHLQVRVDGFATTFNAGGADSGLVFRVGNTNSGDVGGQTYNTVLTLNSNQSAVFAGAVTANSFSGNGSALTNLNASNFTTGTVPVARGGTGLDGSAAANGSLLIGNGTGYTLGTLTAGTGVGIVNGAGTITISNTGVTSLAGTANQVNVSAATGAITLSLPQNIATTSTPTFAGQTLTGGLTGTSATFSGDVTGNSFQANSSKAISSQGSYLQWNREIGAGKTYLVNQKGFGGGGISFGESTTGNAYTENMALSSTGNLTVVGSVTANSFAGNGAALTNLNANNITTGTLPVARGGTGLSTVATNGQLLIGNGTGYTLGTLTGTANQVNVTNGAGTITLSLPQNIATTSTPTFGGITSNGAVNVNNSKVVFNNLLGDKLDLFSAYGFGINNNNLTAYVPNTTDRFSLRTGGNFNGAEVFSVTGAGLITSTGGISTTTGAFSSAVTVNGTLTANGASIFNSAVNVNNNSTVTFNNALGDKLNLFTGYGFGINNSNLTAYVPNATTRFSVRTGGTSTGTEVFSVSGGGNTNVGGTLGVTGGTTLTGALTANGGINSTTGAFSGLALAASLQATTATAINVQGAYLQWNRDGGRTFLVNQKGLGGGGLSFGESTTGNAYTENMALSSTGNLTVVGAVTANSFSGNGSALTNLNASNFTTGTVPVARGGTGLSATPTNGQLLIGNGTGYTLGTLTGTANQVNVINGAGSITLSLPQAIATTSTPTFGGMTLNGAMSFNNVLGDKLNLFTGYGFGINNANLTAYVPSASTRFSVRTGGTSTGTEVFSVTGGGNTSVSGTLGVTGATTLNGNLNATSANFSGNTTISGVTTLNNSVLVNNSIIQFNAVDGDKLKLWGNFGFGINTSNINVFVPGPNMRFSVRSDGNFNGAEGFSVTGAGNTIVGGTLNVAGATALTGALTSNGVTNSNGLININAGASLNAGDLQINSTYPVRFGSQNENFVPMMMYRYYNAFQSSSLRMQMGTSGNGANSFEFGWSPDTVPSATFTRAFTVSTAGNVVAQGSVTATSFTATSDRRLKKNITAQNNNSVLERLEQLQTYSYDYINTPSVGRRIGVIAQEIQSLFPEAVSTSAENGMMSVDYNALGAMAAMGVGQLNSKFKVLDGKVNLQGEKLLELDGKLVQQDGRIGMLETWKTAAVTRMDGMQNAIDLNIQKIADNAVAIQTNTKAIERLDEALFTLDGTVKGNTESIANINARWNRNFSASEDGSLLTVNAVELKVSNFTAQQVQANSVYSQRLEAEIARIADLEVNNLRANSAVANTVQAEQVNTGSVQVYAGVGMPAVLFAAKSDGHYTVSTSSLDGSYATATVIVNAGQAKVVSGASEGIELVAEGNMVKAIAAGKSIKASWIKMG